MVQKLVIALVIAKNSNVSSKGPSSESEIRSEQNTFHFLSVPAGY